MATIYRPATESSLGVWAASSGDSVLDLGQGVLGWLEAVASGAGSIHTVTGDAISTGDNVTGASLTIVAEGTGTVVPALTVNGSRVVFDAIAVNTGGIGGGSIPITTTTRLADITELDPGNQGVVGTSFGNAQVELIPTTGSTLRVYEVAVEIETSVIPTLILSALDPSVPQLRPSWSFIASSGLPQARYRAVATLASAGTPTADPATTTALGLFDSGVVVSSATAATLEYALTALTAYSVHVAAAERLSNGILVWSAWTSANLTPTVSSPSAPTFAANTEVDASARRILNVTNPDASEQIWHAQRSTDAGLTWVDLAGYKPTSMAPAPAGVSAINDDTAPLDVADMQWRARLGSTAFGSTVWGNYTTYAPGGTEALIPSLAAGAVNTWLKAPMSPGVNRTVNVSGLSADSWKHRTKGFAVLGAPSPTVVTDVRDKATFTLALAVQTPDELDALIALVGLNQKLLLSSGATLGSQHRHFYVTDSDFAPITRMAYDRAIGYLTLSCVEVDP